MKKIILFFLLSVTSGYGQITCEQTFTVLGNDDASTTLTVSFGDITCYLGEVQSIKIKDAVMFSVEYPGENCNNYYSFSMDLDGTISDVCPSDLINLDLTGFENLAIISSDADEWPEMLSMSITIEVTYTTEEVPLCDAELIDPVDGADMASLNGVLKWFGASGGAGYLISVGTATNGTDVLDSFDVGNVLTYAIPTPLLPATTYYVTIVPYNDNGIASGCTEFSFTTCGSYTELEETFDDVDDGDIPDCWSTINTSEYEYSFIGADFGEMVLYNEYTVDGFLGVVTPHLSNITSGTHRLKFKAYIWSWWVDTGSLSIGTLTNPTDPTTFNLVQSFEIGTENTDYFVSFADVEEGSYIVFKHDMSEYDIPIFINDIIWEPIPEVAPDCVSDLEIIINDDCGTYATNMSWSAVEGADGYKISIGTETGIYDIVSNIDLLNNLSYSYTGLANTDYYVKVVPYNALGEAIDCTEEIYTTAETGCYCPSVPTSKDGLGITNVEIGEIEYDIPSSSETYIDNTENEIQDLPQGVPANTKITFYTGSEWSSGYTYDVHIWIDFNDDFVFGEDEKVYTGISLAESPTILNATFIMPIDAQIGNHRMRIGSADTGQENPNPCYMESYGVTLDFMINVIEAPACLPVTEATTEDITNESATANWATTATSSSFNLEYGIAGFEPGEGETFPGLTSPTFSFTNLEPNESYEYYIQTVCISEDLSVWTGPYAFKTFCDPFESFTENFGNANSDYMPDCWGRNVQTTSPYAYAEIAWNGQFELYNSDDTNATLMLITPALTDLPNGTHRAKFKAVGNNYNLIAGTMTDPYDASTFTPLQTYTLTGTLTEYVLNIEEPTTDSFIAFKHGLGGTYRSIFIDDFVWEETPTELPECIFDIVYEPNENCGNFATLITWEAVPGADGYKAYVGTATEVYDVVDGQDLGSITSVNFTGNHNTTYYVKFVPYNSFGDALDCEENIITTAEEGCYCSATTTSVDGNGITTVEFGDDVVLTASGPYYTDLTESDIVTVEMGELVEFNINLQTSTSSSTGYDWNIHVWVDLNDNYTFEESEKLFSGISSSASPTTLAASIQIPDNNDLVGLHRVRISGADSGQSTPNPCYTGSWGESLDFTIDIQPSMSVVDSVFEGLKVFPNPANTIVNVNSVEQINTVEIFNLLGQKVMSKSLNSTSNQINISELAIGTYIMKIVGDNKSESVKIVKK